VGGLLVVDHVEQKESPDHLSARCCEYVATGSAGARQPFGHVQGRQSRGYHLCVVRLAGEEMLQLHIPPATAEGLELAVFAIVYQSLESLHQLPAIVKDIQLHCGSDLG